MTKRIITIVIKRILKFNYYKNCLLNNETILKSKQRFKSEAHNVYTKDINKIALRSCYDNRLQHILMVQMLEKYVKQNF